VPSSFLYWNTRHFHISQQFSLPQFGAFSAMAQPETVSIDVETFLLCDFMHNLRINETW